MLIYKLCFTAAKIHFLFFFPPKDSGKVNRRKKKKHLVRQNRLFIINKTQKPMPHESLFLQTANISTCALTNFKCFDFRRMFQKRWEQKRKNQDNRNREALGTKSICFCTSSPPALCTWHPGWPLYLDGNITVNKLRQENFIIWSTTPSMSHRLKDDYKGSQISER